MFSRKIILSAALVFITTLSAQAQKKNDWSIADYFKNLPEKYKTFHGDFHPLSKETTVIDEQNGYAAYLNSPPGGNLETFPIFEMALFKSQTKSPLLVVANRKSDSVCTDYETFFLRRVGSKWTEVSREVLPSMDLKLFWENTPQSAEMLTKIVQPTAISYHFKLPQLGTQIRASLEICDYLEDDAPKKSVKELEKLIGSAGILRLDWNAKSGKFYFARYKKIRFAR